MQPFNANKNQPQPPLLAQQVIQQQEVQRQLRRRAARKQRGSSASSTAPPLPARTRSGRLAVWLGAAIVMFCVLDWMIVITTHIPWVRQHDGARTPMSYPHAALISIIGAGCLLMLYLVRTARLREMSVSQGSASIQRPDEPPGSGAGAKNGPSMHTAGRQLEPDATQVATRRPGEGADTAINMHQGAEAAPQPGAPSLLVISGPGRERQIPIPAGGMVLGRDDQLGPPFTADQLVSRKHASIHRCGDGSVEVADLGSANGTHVNGTQIHAPTRMLASDVLRIGQIELRLVPARSRATSRDDTVVADRTGPRAGEDLLAEGRALYDQDRYEGARQAFLGAADFPGTRGEAQYGLAMTALSLGDPASAEHHLQETVSADPRHANALYQLGALKEQGNHIQDAQAYYRRAVGAYPAHASALAALSRLAGQVPVTASPPTPGTADGDLPSVYRFLLEDPTPISQQTVKLIHRVECEARPLYVAYIGRYIGRTLRITVILAALLIAINIILSLLRGHFPSAVPASGAVSRLSAIAVVCIVLYPLCTAVVGYISVNCTHIRIQKARLQIEKGIFRKHLNNIDFWRVHNIDLDRRLINRLTGDGTLVFSLTFDVLPENYQRHRKKRGRSSEVVEVCGIAQDANLSELHQDLLNLTFLLRGNPIVKGIIQ